MKLVKEMRDEMRGVDSLLLKMATVRSQIIGHMMKLDKLIDKMEDPPTTSDVRGKLDELQEELSEVNTAKSDLGNAVDVVESTLAVVLQMIK